MFGRKKKEVPQVKLEENHEYMEKQEPHAAARAFQEGNKKGRMMVAHKMKAKGCSVEQIAFACKLTPEEVEEA